MRRKRQDFTDSSFFTHPDRHLPSPAEVRTLSGDVGEIPTSKLVTFEHFDLILKFGLHVTLLEAVNLWMVHRVSKDRVPVPEVFGWRVDDEGCVFIYMELVKRPTLRKHWKTLDNAGKKVICNQLSKTVQSLRRLEQDPSDQFIGSINKENLHDYVFTVQPKMGPFPTVKDFNDQFALLHQLRFPTRYEDPNRCHMPDNVDIKFTHADLHRSNIIYWEYCKALYTAPYKDEWRRDGFIDGVIQPWDVVFLVWSEYCMAMGAV
ncbi:phosphotransferase enzyme family protein [Aspergillus lucknowensis]|uniref:Phosphotransferase enzyme family protein n=1 Tax=Aspergillus lucknowensis TaxID=176173 RepID=A0ABR4LX01_9EURO